MSDRGMPGRFVPTQGGSSATPAQPGIAQPGEPDERFVALFGNAPVGVCLSTPDGRFAAVNPALGRVLERLGIDPDAAGLADLARYAGDDDPDPGATGRQWLRAVADVALGGRQVAQVELGLEPPDAAGRWLQATTALVGLGERRYLLTLVEDVTRRRQAQRRLVRSALHDEVTGLANRALLADRMEAALDRSATSGVPVGVLHIDLSEAETHPADYPIDQVLTEVAGRLSPLLRTGDSAGRVGVDRLVVIAGDVDAAALDDLTGRVTRALAEPLPVDLTGEPTRLTAVVGSCLAHPGDTLRSVLQRAQQSGQASARVPAPAAPVDLPVEKPS